MIIDQSRAMSATLPSKWTGDAFGTVVMRPHCPLWRHPALNCLRPRSRGETSQEGSSLGKTALTLSAPTERVY
jgi:hypothetical protein